MGPQEQLEANVAADCLRYMVRVSSAHGWKDCPAARHANFRAIANYLMQSVYVSIGGCNKGRFWPTTDSSNFAATFCQLTRNERMKDATHYSIPIADFFKAAFSVDCVIYGYDATGVKVLLIERGADPYDGYMALPGDLVYPDEDLDSAAIRVLQQLTGLTDIFIEQVHTFGRVNRHPLGRVVTVAYYALINIAKYDINASSWAENAQWHPLSDVPILAFDHNRILDVTTEELRNKVQQQPIGFELLPPKFTLTELQQLYEAVLNTTFDKANFRKKILSMDLLLQLNESQRNVAHRPAKLYAFDPDRYAALVQKGFSFGL